MSPSGAAAVGSRSQAKAGGAQAWAFVLLRVALGVLLIAKGLGKLDWALDAGPLFERLTRWAADETLAPASRAYAAALIPGAPVFARLVLVGELGGGAALVLGFSARVVALLATLMVLNFHLATGSLLTWEFLTDGTGLVAVAALVALALGARALPLSVRP